MYGGDSEEVQGGVVGCQQNGKGILERLRLVNAWYLTMPVVECKGRN